MSVIYTIGYEGTDIERFVATLKAVGVRRVADVRAVPISRKKGFSKNKLAARLEVESIEYLAFQTLGDPSQGERRPARDITTFSVLSTVRTLIPRTRRRRSGS